MSALPLSAQTAGNLLANGAAPPTRKVAGADDAQNAAKEFEAFFISQMLEQMFKDVPVDGPFGGGYGEGVYRSFLLKEYGQAITKAGGVGIADAVSRELLKLQEGK